MSFVWKGEKISARIIAAERSGIDTTMAACVVHAKKNHGPGAHGSQRFESQTGELERSVRIIRAARREDLKRSVVGRWGSISIVYAHRQEFGFQGQDSRGASVNAPAYPYLFPAARVEYPKLAGRIKAAYAR